MMGGNNPFMYDLIVIGDDLSSHVAAAYAGHKGMSTLLIADSGLGGLKLIGDFVFNIDPSPVSGFGPDQPCLSVLSEMDIPLPENHEAPVNPAFQVILPEHRIDFYNDPDLLMAELTREFPALAREIREYYVAALDASFLFQNWLKEHPRLQPQSLKEFISYLKIFPLIFRYKFGAAKFDKTLSRQPTLEKVWEAQQTLLGLNNDDLFSFGSAFQYCAPLRGISCWPQGKQYLFNELVKKLESSNGVYLNSQTITSISPDRGIELELKSQDQSIAKVSAHQLIISTKSDALSLLAGKHKYINFSDRIRPAKVAYYPFTLFMGISTRCLPQEIARHVAVVSDPEKGIYDRNLILLETGLPDGGEISSGGKTSFSATVYLPDQEQYWTIDSLKDEANSILVRLEAFLPFLKNNIVVDNINESIDLSIACRKVTSPKYTVRNALFTSFAAKSHKTRFDNVILTGASLLTDAGFDAEVMSGKIAALHVLAKRN